MGGLSYLAEGETSDGAISLVQGHSFTVTISGDVTFGQNHAAICEACRREASFKTEDEENSEREQTRVSCLLTNGHEVQILVYTEARHLCGFVARDRREDPCAERSPAVFFVKVPDLHLVNRNH